MRGVDHVVVCVRDLARGRARYAQLGFTLTPPADHPFGTSNSLVQFAGRSFVELLAIRDPLAIPPHAPPGQFSFAAFNAAFLARCGEAASMLVLRGDDARADVAAFRAAGLTTYEPFDFGREARQPDGSTSRLGFSLAFVTDPAMPDLGFFTCQHRHAPELFWKPDYQTHANGAAALAEVILGTAEPDTLRELLARMSDGDAAAGTGPPVTVADPEALRRRFPELADAGPRASPRLAACRIAVADLARVQVLLAAAGVPHRAAGGSVVVPPASALGLCLEFSAGGHALAQAAAARSATG